MVKDRETAIAYGPITFLPEINKNVDETLLIILRDLCGVESELPEPKWIQQYHAPGQSGIDSQIKTLREAIKCQCTQLEQLNKKRTQKRDCLKLLYEREFALEPIVRDILRLLGADVEDPVEKNKEDGWLIVSVDGLVLESVLEIKSTRSEQFDEGGRKQLIDW